MPSCIRISLLAVIAVTFQCAVVCGSDAAGDAPEGWKAVAAILEARCVRCHNRERHEGSLALDSRAGAFAGGDSGAAITPDAVEESLLLQQVASDGGPPAMPRGGPPLSPEEIASIRRWITAGAPWPEGVELKPRTQASSSGDWWSLRPITRPRVPELAAKETEWIRNPLDAFILAKLRDQNLSPSAEVDRPALLRRVAYDLTGLPPTPEEIESFTADSDPLAYEKQVDRLLASPRYGERWARHWLDVVHFGETDDFGRDYLRPNAWPYRDYVIRSFNGDKRYSRFVAEQLAGDVLDPDDPEGVAATGFIVAGPWDYTGHVLLFDDAAGKELARSLDRDDMVTNAMSTFTSLTVHCARCHDHKFDPITQDDYYSLQAVFAGVNHAERPLDARIHYNPAFRWWFFPAGVSVVGVVLLLATNRLTARVCHWISFRRISVRRWQTLGWLLGGMGFTVLWGLWLSDYQDLPFRIERRVQTLLKWEKPFRYDKAYFEAPKVYAATALFPRIETKTGTYAPAPRGLPRRVDLLARGNVETPLGEARPGAVACVQPLDARFQLQDEQNEGERRMALAGWIVDERNPLTWRSIVNRVWHYHFGAGLVDTPSDFGQMGSRPSHPELLDWLAADFRDGEQSFKSLHRLIVTSATYRQTAAHRADCAKLDSQNRLLWRMNRRRLEAEAIRDTVLQITEKLDRRMYGPGFRPFDIENPKADIMQFRYDEHDPDDPQTQRRTIYRFITRSVSDPFLETLDCAASSQFVPARTETNTALQALALLNNSFMLRQAEHLAASIAEGDSTEESQVAKAFLRILGRVPRPEELQELTRFAHDSGLPATCRLLFNLNEFSFVD